MATVHYKKCPRCGQPAVLDMRVCQRCGHVYRSVMPAAQSPLAPAAVPPRDIRHSPLVTAAVAGLVLVTVVAVLVWLVNSSLRPPFVGEWEQMDAARGRRAYLVMRADGTGSIETPNDVAVKFHPGPTGWGVETLRGRTRLCFRWDSAGHVLTFRPVSEELVSPRVVDLGPPAPTYRRLWSVSDQGSILALADPLRSASEGGAIIEYQRAR